MQQAVLHHFPYAQATYRFTHRDKDVFFTRKCVEEFKRVVSRMQFFLGVICLLNQRQSARIFIDGTNCC
jgi:hypothetical protein